MANKKPVTSVVAAFASSPAPASDRVHGASNRPVVVVDGISSDLKTVLITKTFPADGGELSVELSVVGTPVRFGDYLMCKTVEIGADGERYAKSYKVFLPPSEAVVEPVKSAKRKTTAVTVPSAPPTDARPF